MGLFLIKNNKPSLTPEAMAIPEFKLLWTRDQKRHKTSSIEDLAYVYYMADWQSPYKAYPPEERGAAVRKDIIERQKWREDTAVRAAIRKYEEMQETPTLRYLKSVEGAVEEMMNFFDNVNFNPEKKDENDKKVPVSDIKKVMESVAKAASILKTLQELKERVMAEQNAVENIRGGGSAGDYED